MIVASVLLPVRNGMPYLPEAVGSILAQSFSNFELLIIDDGSTDGTAAYLAGLRDPRARVLSAGGAGLALALNLGLAEARGRFIARQDADDVSAPDRLLRQVLWLQTRADIDVLACSADFIDAAGLPVTSAWTRQVHEQWDRAIEPDAIAQLMPLTCCIFHATVMARRDVLLKAGGYDQSAVPAEDYDLWLRLLPVHRIARLPERLYTVRVHDASSSTQRRTDQQARVIEAKLRYVRRQVPGLPWPVRLALPCDDRGAALFRRHGPAEGFEAHADEATADVVAVTDFQSLPRFRAALPPSGYTQLGNLFVRHR